MVSCNSVRLEKTLETNRTRLEARKKGRKKNKTKEEGRKEVRKDTVNRDISI